MSTDFFHDAIQPSLFEDTAPVPKPVDIEGSYDVLLYRTGNLAFQVIGRPAPQGSKSTFGGRPTKAGGISRPHTVEANKRTRPWRQDVFSAADDARIQQEWPTEVGPVEVTLTFYKPRPKNHYGTGKNSNVLKNGMPYYVTTGPDVDKLSRAILDSLTNAQVYLDDKQVADLHAKHVYAERGSTFAGDGGVFVQVQPLEPAFLCHPSAASKA